MLLLLSKIIGIIIITIAIVKLLTKILIPWSVKTFFPEKYESFKKKYLDTKNN